MEYTPLEEYGVVGNRETCALVGPAGSVDWCAFPHLESSSLFAALLDAERGGYFRIAPTAEFETDREYIEHTNVLRTTFHTAAGTATLTDFMPVQDDSENPERALYRRVTGVDRTVELGIEFVPRFEYARAATTVKAAADGVRATGRADAGTDRDEHAFLSSPVPLAVNVSADAATGSWTLDAGEEAWFVLRYEDAVDGADASEEPTDPERALEETIDYWSEWAHTCGGDSECVFAGPGHDLAVRSGLVLKLLTHHGTGTIAAAATTSLPEEIGGVRNWDYRFNWVRDAAFTIQALSNLGHAREARDYFEWFLDLCHADAPEEILPLYGLHGETDTSKSANSTTSRATGTPNPCGSATPPPTSANSTSTANSSSP